MTISAFLDANVLASKTQRDWLFKTSLDNPQLLGLYSSGAVIEETLKVFQERNPLAPAHATLRLVNLIKRVLVDVVEAPTTGPADGLVAKGDQHVHRGVLASGAEILVTDNLRDFPPLPSRDYRVTSSDEFLCQLYYMSPMTIQRVAQSEHLYWTNHLDSARRAKSLQAALVDAACPNFANIVRSLKPYG